MESMKELINELRQLIKVASYRELHLIVVFARALIGRAPQNPNQDKS